LFDSQSSSSSLRVICFSSLARRVMIFLRAVERPSRPMRMVDPSAELRRARREAMGDQSEGDRSLFLLLWMSLTISTDVLDRSSREGRADSEDIVLSAYLQILVVNLRQAPLSEVFRPGFLTMRVIFVGLCCTTILESTTIGMWSSEKNPSNARAHDGIVFPFQTK